MAGRACACLLGCIRAFRVIICWQVCYLCAPVLCWLTTRLLSSELLQAETSCNPDRRPGATAQCKLPQCHEPPALSSSPTAYSLRRALCQVCLRLSAAIYALARGACHGGCASRAALHCRALASHGNSAGQGLVTCRRCFESKLRVWKLTCLTRLPLLLHAAGHRVRRYVWPAQRCRLHSISSGSVGQ